jgi:hypothetical protein
MKHPITGPNLKVFDSRAMSWEERFIPRTGQKPRPRAHGMFVLKGTLATHDGAFGPGTFAWFPEDMAMQHGATQTEPVTVLFLTNKKFEIHCMRLAGMDE